ncbi:hypothetical protein Poly51_51680 [Rubripirellula tenax]|uniref:Uncharacterized protein n=2 Tax=Rubripirellula tenax TaxID=2528015 RepID=A0A5C6EEV8_9BACT|nr:hypothetical protein Poly51_51680 [Rubripirellula tenax]
MTLQWERLLPEFIGKAGGFLAGIFVSWFLLFRRRLNAIQRLQSGDSDDFVFQVHHLSPDGTQSNPGHSGDVSSADNSEATATHADDPTAQRWVLLFRNLAPKTTLNDLYDNIAVREAVEKAANSCTLADPILRTEGTLGFELVNDAMGHIAGLFAVTSIPREPWLFAMTCEDRTVVRKKCVRCFLIRPDDLGRFADWKWCRQSVSVEKPWHWFRIVALHRIAIAWLAEVEQQQLEAQHDQSSSMPLVDKQVRHDRIRTLSLGVYSFDQPIGEPCQIDWSKRVADLEKLGLNLESN